MIKVNIILKMYGPSLGLKKPNKSSELKLMKSQNTINNSIEMQDKINHNQKDKLAQKSYITKKNNPEEYNKKINQYILFHQNYTNSIESRNNDNIKTLKKPILITKQSSIQLYNNEEKYLRNNFNKLGKNMKNNNYIAPSFDYNIKNNHKNNNIKLNIKNSNSIPIKLQDNDLKNSYKNKLKNKQNLISNSSIDVKGSSSSLNGIDSLMDNMKKRNVVNRKNQKNQNYYNINYNTNYNPEVRKYLSFTPGPVRKTNYIKNKVSTSNNFEDQKRKEDIKMIFEREFKRKMNTKKQKNNKNSHNTSSMTKYSRNNKTEENKNFKSSQSQKNINNKYKSINENEFRTLNSYKRKNNTHSNFEKKSNFSIEKYHLILEQKIVKLNQDITILKNEEQYLQKKLINYQDKEKECNDIRKIREEIEKYKIIFEKSSKTCEEYLLEIQKIKNIIGEDDNKDKNK